MKIELIIKNLLLSCMLLSSVSFALPSNSVDIEEMPPIAQTTPKKLISITIDDLPFVGESRNFHLNMMIETLIKEQVSATGFIIASEVHKDNWDILQKFRNAGFGLGNHTLTHANLSALNANGYQHEIQAADKILAPVLTKPKYFRYPYLAMSSGQKREDILCFLAKKNYRIAPITVDSKDFAFNQRLFAVPELNRRAYLEELKPFYLDFIWQQTILAEEHNAYHHNTQQAQILLIHANLLNAYVLSDIINLYKQKGYAFVSLQDALKTFKYPVQCSKPRHRLLPKIQSINNSTIEAFADWD